MRRAIGVQEEWPSRLPLVLQAIQNPAYRPADTSSSGGPTAKPPGPITVPILRRGLRDLPANRSRAETRGVGKVAKRRRDHAPRNEVVSGRNVQTNGTAGGKQHHQNKDGQQKPRALLRRQ